MNKIMTYIYLLCISGIILAGTDGTIRGRAIANEDGQPLIGVQVYIEQEGIGSVTDIDGNFLLLNVPIGEHLLTVNMLGYATIKSNLSVVMDRTTWYNPSLVISRLEGETVFVSGEKELVEKGRTSKKITVSKEAIEALPIKDISDLYSLQAGVVKIEGGMQGSVPDNEDKGLEEVHVRGGRSGEIAYMIDGLYIRNPIFGGIGSGTRLNLFAVKEFDWQPGGFNAEYGDAMSAISNMHTMSGGKKYQFKYKYETSLLGAALGNNYDELRGYDDHNIGFGGPVPLIKNLNFWVSSQQTGNDNYRVYEFDDIAYQENDPGNDINRSNIVAPWDTYSGMKGFGFNNTKDIFSKLSYKLGKSLRFSASYWTVENHRKIFDADYLYWDEGQNELFRDTERATFEINHTLSNSTFYTLRLSNFSQGSFQGVRWQDSDSDGYPDWYEWSYGAGQRTVSDPYNADVVPYTEANGIVSYSNRDGLGPDQWTSGWYLGADPGNYNWEVAEDFDDLNNNGICDNNEFVPYSDQDANQDGLWNGPVLVEDAIYRDGSYWLTSQMYVDNQDFLDEYFWYREYDQDPYNAYYDEDSNFGGFNFDQGYFDLLDSLYFLPPSPDDADQWFEGRIFGGSDRFFGTSNAETNEIRLDLTSQFTNEWRSRFGFDLKSHKLNFYEVADPWNDAGAITQRFSEQWDDYGQDLTPFTDIEGGVPDLGEGDGIQNYGEEFDDFNGDGKWNNFVEPMEYSAYWQNTFEVPWMVVNAGLRLDAVNYNTKIWANPELDFSSSEPWFYVDWGYDGLQWVDGNNDGDYLDNNGNADQYIDNNGVTQYEIAPDTGEGDGEYNSSGNGQWDGYNPNCILCGQEEFTDENGNGFYDQGEPFIDEGEPSGLLTQAAAVPGSRVIFKKSEWLYELSPRIGFSHVITDKATFTFNYGVYHQTPVYERIYLNTNRQEDPEEIFEESAGFIGNATMAASRTQSYEFAFNVQGGANWAYTVGAWVKDMDKLVTSKSYRTGVYEYSVADNGDFGRAIGIDLTFESRGAINTTIQYTYSSAKANGDYDLGAFENEFVDAPAQEYIMPFDRTHDLTGTFYTKLPFGINAGLTYFYQSGFPFTPSILNASGDKPFSDLLNKYSERSQAFQRVDLSFSKFVALNNTKLTLGLNIYNLFDLQNVNNIYPLTGEADNPGEYYLNEDIQNIPSEGGDYSSGYYDRPWYYSSPREINFFVRFDFN